MFEVFSVRGTVGFFVADAQRNGVLLVPSRTK